MIGFLVVFLTILNAYMLSTPNEDLFSLQSFFESSLDLPQLSSAADLQQVQQQLVRISGRAKPLMLLSSTSLVDSDAGDLELISEARNFPSEQNLELPPDIRCRVDGPEWTMSAWVKGKGNLLKQVLGKFTCWAWEADDVMRLRFGGHDSERGSTVLEGGTVGDQLQHYSIVVSQERSVKFFRNGTLESTVQMTRDVTDCNGQLVVADSLVTIAALKLHARALKDREVQDMYLAGRPLVEMATGKSPVVVQSSVSTTETTTENPELDLVLQQNSLQLDAYEASVNPAVWSGQEAPLLQGTVQVQEKADPMFNLSYFSLIDEPVRVEASVPVDLATLPELPSDESFTYTFWSRMSSDGAPFAWFLKGWSDRGSSVISNSIEFKRPYMGISFDPDDDATVSFTGILPTAAGVVLGGPKWRLFVFVYDVTTQSMQGYLDGHLIQSTKIAEMPQVALVNVYPDPLPRKNAVFPRGPDETAEIGLVLLFLLLSIFPSLHSCMRYCLSSTLKTIFSSTLTTFF